MDPSSRSSFVIGPIGDRLAPVGSEERTRYEDALQVYEQVIQEACKMLGLVAVRADDITRSGEIPEQVFRRLRDADIVIADLTDANPNVMYELGLRHATGRLTVQIGEHGRLPFDVSAIRTIQFVRTPRGLVDARERLRRVMETALSEGADLVAAARIFQSDAATKGEIAAPTEDEEQPGFLEVLADMESALPAMTEDVNSIAGLITEFGTLADKGTSAIKQSDARGGGASERLSIAVRFARALDEQAGKFEMLATQYEDHLAQVDAGMDYLISRIEADPQLASELGEFPGGVHQMAVAAATGMEQSDHLAEIIEGLGAIARPLRVAARRTSGALRRVSRTAPVIQAWDSRISAVTSGLSQPVGRQPPTRKPPTRPRPRAKQKRR